MAYHIFHGRNVRQTFPSSKPTAPAREPSDQTGVWPFTDAPKLYQISYSDWDAQKKYLNALSNSVKYTHKVHGNKILSGDDMSKWSNLWKRWLMLVSKIDRTEAIRDSGLLSRLLTAAAPAQIFIADAHGTLAMMTEENKVALDRIVNEAHTLHTGYRLKGMADVSIPYMGDLVMLVRTLPKDITLADMSKRLRESATVGDRLLDENTAWWQWKLRPDTKGLRIAVANARTLATEFDTIAAANDPSDPNKVALRMATVKFLSKLAGPAPSPAPGAVVPRTQAQALSQIFLHGLTSVFAEAAALYGAEEVRSTARANFKQDVTDPQPGGLPLWAWCVIAGVGYVGLNHLLTPSRKIVVQSGRTGYHPEEDNDRLSFINNQESEDEHEF